MDVRGFIHKISCLQRYLILLVLGMILGGCILLNREPRMDFFYVDVMNGTQFSIQVAASIGDNREEYTLAPGERHQLVMFSRIASAKKEFLYPSGLNGLKWHNDKKRTGYLNAEQMKNLCKVSEFKRACLITLTDALFNTAPNP